MRGKDGASFGQKWIPLVREWGIAERRFAPRGMSACHFNCQAEVFGSVQDFGKESIGAEPIITSRQQLRSQTLGLNQQQRTSVLAGDGQSRFKIRPGFRHTLTLK